MAGAGIAVLYLVGPDADPPMPTTYLEDWIRVPGDDRDLSARLAVLELRAATYDASPRVDDHGRLHYRGRLVALPPLQARLAEVLTERFGDVVTDLELKAVATSGSASAPEPSVRTQLAQLRVRLRDMGLAIRRIRSRGYKLITVGEDRSRPLSWRG